MRKMLPNAVESLSLGERGLEMRFPVLTVTKLEFLIGECDEAMMLSSDIRDAVASMNWHVVSQKLEAWLSIMTSSAPSNLISGLLAIQNAEARK